MADVMVNPELTSPFHDALRSIDPAAPLTVDILVKLFAAQSRHLLDGFNKKIAEQAKTIDEQADSIKFLKSENAELRAELNDIQQYSRRNSIRIDGIPSPDNGERETVKELEGKTKKLLKTLLK